jgi:hypothetical protein
MRDEYDFSQSIPNSYTKNLKKQTTIMTLAEVLPGAQQLTAPEKLKLIRILAEDLERGPSAAQTQTDAETVFWLQASQSSLDAVWNNDEDDVYAQLL